MATIHHHVLATISGSIYGVAGYYSDNDSTQHVVVATTDGTLGTLSEIHWNGNTTLTHPQQLAQFNGIASLCGFFTSDDNFQHVIVATRDGRLNELYFIQPDIKSVTSRFLLQLSTTLGPGIGMAGFFSSDGDNLRHATVGSKEVNTDNILHEIVWKAHVNPSARNLTTQFTLRDVAGIAGFFDLCDHSRDVIVALKGGDVYDVRYSGGILGGGQITKIQVTTFSLPSELVNVAAFVDTDARYRHVIVLDASGQLYDYTYIAHEEGLGQKTFLTNIANVVDIVAYYSHYDTTCHVIAATEDGNLHEVYYS
jgi:hypothetical protein